MKVFVTGGSGFIGTGVVSELLHLGHTVVALSRSQESADKLRTLGSDVEILPGNLTDLKSLRKGAAQADATIHLGFVHDFANFEECCKVDQEAVISMLNSIEGSGKTFIYTSGVLGLPEGKSCNEKDKPDPNFPSPRSHTEEVALTYKDKGVKAMVVKLGASVHGKGDHAFVPALIGIAKSSGESAYVGDGQNVWPVVQRLDAVRLFIQALKHGTAGTVYHAVAECVKLKDIAQIIGEISGLPVRSISLNKASRHFGAMSFFVNRDVNATSEITRAELHWEPQGMTLLNDLRENYV